MRLLLRVIPIFLAVLAVLFVLRGAGSSGKSGRAAASRRKQKTSRLVKDPVCGTYVAAGEALTATRSSETFHFCSQECLDKFLVR